MTLAEPRRSRDRALDDLDQVAGPLERLLRAPFDDRPRDLPRVALFAVPVKDLRELALVRVVHNVLRGQLRGRVHAHVERCIDCIREPAVRAVELHRRHAEVEEDRIGLHAVGGELLQHL
jgi:hypothetical protein